MGDVAKKRIHCETYRMLGAYLALLKKLNAKIVEVEKKYPRCEDRHDDPERG